MAPQIFGDRIQALQSGLDFSAVKNRVISANIANVETPGYKAFRVLMDEKMNSGKATAGHLVKTDPNHLDGSHGSSDGEFNVVRDESTTMRADGNNVDLERELAELSSNSIYYTSLSRFIAKNFAGLRSVISEGRK